jgi:hypothetical protein
VTIAAVQEPTGVTADNTTTVSKAFTANVAVDDVVVITCRRLAGGTNTPFVAGDCTKIAGTATIGTITLDKQANANSSHPCQAGVWSVPVTGAGSLTMQVSGPASSYFNLTVGSYSGLDTSASRVEATNSGTAVVATTPANTGSATSASDALFVAVLASDQDDNAGFTVGNSFTELYEQPDGTAHQTGESDRRIVTGGTTTQGTWTLATANGHGYAAVLVVYKKAPGGPAGGGNSVYTDQPRRDVPIQLRQAA